MKKILHIFLAISLNFTKNVTCIELLKEQAWIDTQGRDKFFDYAELAEENRYYYNTRSAHVNNHNNNLNLELFNAQNVDTTTKSETLQTVNPNSNIVSLFLNTMKNVMNPHQKRASTFDNKETYKGLDIAFDSKTNILPNLGNNQDFKFIMLGTKWCGAGDMAKDKNDIGYFYITDNCCREHDLCPMTLGAQEEKFGLKNSGKFTRSHCDCDQKFYQCLKNAKTLVSTQVGKFYFNVLGHQCFKEDFPMKRCKSSVRSRCVNYEVNSSESKIFQWFDNPWF